MWTIVVPLLMCALGQPAADSKARTIAPFLDSGDLAVVHLDMTRADVPAVVARLTGGPSPGPIGDASKARAAWFDNLRRAGAKELFVVINAADMPGLPVVVVPTGAGSDAAEIGRLFCGAGQAWPPVPFPTCATLHDAVVAGTAAALERVRSGVSQPRPELDAAFAAVNDGSIGLRLVLVPSADTRRVVEETVPTLPRELGGGPVTTLTRGILWAAFGLDAGPKPSLRLVVATPGGEAAGNVRRLGQDLLASVHRLPDVQAIFPELPGLASQFKTEIGGDRITVTADAQVAASLFEAASRQAWEGARRAQCVNNEKQIALAMHNYASSHKRMFPPGYSTDKSGKPLLSWRVLILPYLEQEALYKEFHHDEPWDSPHNRALIAKMPQVYRCPQSKDVTVRQGKTRYVAPRGAGTILGGAESVALKDITDGTSNTFLFVEASDDRAVVWSKPDDWDVGPDPKIAAAGVFNAHTSGRSPGTNCTFADGSVRFLRETIKPDLLRGLITYRGGEALSADDN